MRRHAVLLKSRCENDHRQRARTSALKWEYMTEKLRNVTDEQHGVGHAHRRRARSASTTTAALTHTAHATRRRLDANASTQDLSHHALRISLQLRSEL